MDYGGKCRATDGKQTWEPNLYNGLYSFFFTSKFPTLQTPTQSDLHPEHFLFQKVAPIGVEVWQTDNNRSIQQGVAVDNFQTICPY